VYSLQPYWNEIVDVIAIFVVGGCLRVVEYLQVCQAQPDWPWHAMPLRVEH
jgi:hypothetical protein